MEASHWGELLSFACPKESNQSSPLLGSCPRGIRTSIYVKDTPTFALPSVLTKVWRVGKLARLKHPASPNLLHPCSRSLKHSNASSTPPLRASALMKGPPIFRSGRGEYHSGGRFSPLGGAMDRDTVSAGMEPAWHRPTRTRNARTSGHCGGIYLVTFLLLKTRKYSTAKRCRRKTSGRTNEPNIRSSKN